MVTKELFDDIMTATNHNEGICLACGARREGVEPDAEGYECYDCGENQVAGAEQAFLLGYFD